MLPRHHRISVTFEVDRWLILGIVGTIAAIVFAAGEFLGWWDQLGEFGFWASVVTAAVGYLLTASRRQAKVVIGGLGRVEANTAPIPRIEANTEAIPRIEANTAAALDLLGEIRDRLPPPRT